MNKFKKGDRVQIVSKIIINYLRALNIPTIGRIISLLPINSDNKYYRIDVSIDSKTPISLTIAESLLQLIEPVPSDTSTTQDTFTSLQELISYLAVDGNKVYCENNNAIYYFSNGKLFGRLLEDNLPSEQVTLNVFDFNGIENFSKYQEPIWYTALPEQKILCWASHTSDKELELPDKRTPALIVRYTPLNEYPFSTNHVSWKFARPITPEEAVKFIFNLNQ